MDQERKYDPRSPVCCFCSDHYQEGQGMYTACGGEWCEEAEQDLRDMAHYNASFGVLDPCIYCGSPVTTVEDPGVCKECQAALDPCFNCPATEDFEDLTPEEEAEAQALEDPEITPAAILYKLDAAKWAAKQSEEKGHAQAQPRGEDPGHDRVD